MSLLAGWGGVWSVGQPALFAIGAYTAVHGTSHGWSLELIVLVACGLAALTGGFLGFAGARFSVLYISLLTLAFNLVVLEIIGMWQSLTGGDQGMPVDVLESVFGPTLQQRLRRRQRRDHPVRDRPRDRRPGAPERPADAPRGREVASRRRANGRDRARVADGARLRA